MPKILASKRLVKIPYFLCSLPRKTKMPLKKRQAKLVAWRLDKKLEGNQFYTKQDFRIKSFSLFTLSTVEYSSGYLLFILYLMICF